MAIFCIENQMTLDAAFEFFYCSDVYRLISAEISDMHCMSDKYLAEELRREYMDLKL